MHRSDRSNVHADCLGDPGLGLFLQQMDPLAYYALFPNPDAKQRTAPPRRQSLPRLLWHRITSQFRTGAATLTPRALSSPTPALTALPSDPSHPD